MSLLQSVPVDEIRARGSIKDGDVARLAAAWRELGDVAVADVETLMRLNTACPVKGQGWSDLFIEIVTECVIRQIEPAGYVTLAKMRWLIARIVAGDGVAGRAELELIANLLDKSRWSPASLAAFAIGQITRAVRSGEGPLRGGQPRAPGEIVPAELDYVRRILFAYGSGKSLPVTHAEAAALFDLGEALAGDAMPAEWIDLFVKSVSNAILAASGLAAPSREEALRIGPQVGALARRSAAEIVRAAFAPASTGAAADMTRQAPGQTQGVPMVWGTYRMLSAEERALARLERQRIEIITDEAMPAADAAWLAGRFAGRSRLNAAELALVAALERDCPVADQALTALVARGGCAA